jgi:hypothetical protein
MTEWLSGANNLLFVQHSLFHVSAFQHLLLALLALSSCLCLIYIFTFLLMNICCMMCVVCADESRRIHYLDGSAHQ